MRQEVKGVGKDSVFPFIVADNWYSPEEEQLIWKELDFYYRPQNLESSASNSAIENHQVLSNSWRIYPMSIFDKQHLKFSTIVSSVQKYTTPKFKEFVEDLMPQGIQFKGADKIYTMVSYYDDSQDYKPHYDSVQFTSIIWFYKQPKKFNGGDFVFPQINQTIECKHNRMVFFPSYYLHSVTPISIEPQDRNKGLGRFALTNFFHDCR